MLEKRIETDGSRLDEKVVARIDNLLEEKIIMPNQLFYNIAELQLI